MDERGQDPGTEAPNGCARAIAPPLTLTRPVGVELELAHACQRLDGERLVQLDDVEVSGGQPGPLQSLSCRRDRPDTHHVGWSPLQPPTPQRVPWAPAVPAHPLLGRNQDGGGTVVHRRGVACGDGPALAEDRAEHGERLKRSIGPRSLVGGHDGTALVSVIGRCLDPVPTRRETEASASMPTPPASGCGRGRTWSSICLWNPGNSRRRPRLGPRPSASSPWSSAILGLTSRQPSVVSNASAFPSGKVGRAWRSPTVPGSSIPNAATITSPQPPAKACAAATTACSPDPQSRLTVLPGTVSGRPASSTA